MTDAFWGFMQVLATVLGTAFSTWIAYRVSVKPKMAEIHTLVNGNLSAEKEDNANLRAQLLNNGIEPAPRVASGPVAPMK
jgi:hypothetical protein